MEEHAPTILPVAGQGVVGGVAVRVHARARLRMADDRRQPYESACTRDRGEGGQPADGAHKRGLNTKIHLAVDAHGMPLRVIVTAGPVADCTKAEELTEGIENVGSLIADKGYDTDQIEAHAKQRGMDVVIPPRSNRVNPRQYDQYLYKLRHLVENASMKLKGWRSIATRYAKNASSFLAAVQIRCLFLWLKIS